MIKAVMTNQDTREVTMLLGLSDENWRRMRRLGQPIKFGVAIDGKPISVAIMAGLDEDSMRAQLAEWTDLPPVQEGEPL